MFFDFRKYSDFINSQSQIFKKLNKESNMIPSDLYKGYNFFQKIKDNIYILRKFN